MTRDRPPTIFPSFNARTLTPSEVAQSFIPPAEFWSLARSANSVLVGPRGSGKTTLLRMLEARAMTLWDHPQARRLRDQTDYNGVYVPTDRLWGAQVQGLEFDDDGDRVRASVSAFTDRVLECLALAMEQQLALDVVASGNLNGRATEAEIVARVASAWMVDCELPSLKALIWGLRRRQMDLYTVLSATDRGRTSLAKGRPPLVDRAEPLDFAQAAVCAVAAYNDTVGASRPRWCLLLDEFELAGQHVGQAVFNAMRSAREDVLIKVSFAPYIDTPAGPSDRRSAVAGQDYDFIALPSQTGEESHAFARELPASAGATRWALGHGLGRPTRPRRLLESGMGPKRSADGACDPRRSIRSRS